LFSLKNSLYLCPSSFLLLPQKIIRLFVYVFFICFLIKTLSFSTTLPSVFPQIFSSSNFVFPSSFLVFQRNIYLLCVHNKVSQSIFSPPGFPKFVLISLCFSLVFGFSHFLYFDFVCTKKYLNFFSFCLGFPKKSLIVNLFLTSFLVFQNINFFLSL